MIEFLVVLIVIGVLLWLVEAYVPMPPPIKTVIRVVGVLIMVLYILRFFLGWPIRLP